MGGRDCSGGNQDANGDFVSYINTFDLDHFQTLLSKLLYIEVPPFQNKNSKTVVILIFIWETLCKLFYTVYSRDSQSRTKFAI